MLASDYDGTLRQGNEVKQKTIDEIKNVSEYVCDSVEDVIEIILGK